MTLKLIEALDACFQYAALCLRNGPTGKVGEAVLSMPSSVRDVLKNIKSEDLQEVSRIHFFLKDSTYYKYYTQRRRVPFKL